MCRNSEEWKGEFESATGVKCSECLGSGQTKIPFLKLYHPDVPFSLKFYPWVWVLSSVLSWKVLSCSFWNGKTKLQWRKMLLSLNKAYLGKLCITLVGPSEPEILARQNKSHFSHLFFALNTELIFLLFFKKMQSE